MPVVGNTHDLQNRRSEIGTWFLDAAAKVNPRILQGHTSQGFYVMGADGKAYGFNNNRSVERVLAFMQKGLDGFRSDPPFNVEIRSQSNPHPRPPEGATVLRLYSRITPLPEGCPDSNANLQRDHFWILREEVGQIAAERIPASLINRLCRFALVDAVRGEPDFWKPEEVLAKEFSIRRLSPGEAALSGKFSMRTANGARGIEGKLTARLIINGADISSFTGYAETTAWGNGTYTPGAPEGKFPLKFAFILAPESADTVAPQAAMYGREYLNPR